MAAIAWERKKTKTEDSGITTLWLEHHQPVSIQCKGGRPTIKEFVERMVWWWGGGGGRAYFWYPSMASFEGCFARMASLPKIGGRRLGPLDAC